MGKEVKKLGRRLRDPLKKWLKNVFLPKINHFIHLNTHNNEDTEEQSITTIDVADP